MVIWKNAKFRIHIAAASTISTKMTVDDVFDEDDADDDVDDNDNDDAMYDERCNDNDDDVWP